ncbi:calcium-binding protein [Methylobacterium sp. A54F]
MAPHPNFTFTLSDPNNQVADLRGQILATAVQAGAYWAQFINSSAAIEVAIVIAPVGDAQAASTVSVPIGTYGSYTLLEDGTPFELATGVDPNGAGPDITIRLDPNYARNELWYDPSADSALYDGPLDRTDAFSIFTHSLGHGLGFNGLRDGGTGVLPGNSLNTFDLNVTGFNGGLGFYGATAQAVFGGPVPLTVGNYGHYGNIAEPPGTNPLAGLMNGVAVYRGARYVINDLDLAILTDVGVPVLQPRTGTEGADLVSYGPLAQEVLLLGGNDTAVAGGGNDVVYGNQGDDLLFGNQGADTLWGGQGDDGIYGGQGDDLVLGNIGRDVLFGNDGNDLLFGGQGNDVLYGGQGDDILSGDLGDDVLSGDLGADRYVIGANAGYDLVLGFSQAQGDRLDLQGQSYALTTSSTGNALLVLSGGGAVELAGVRASEVNAGAFA